MTKQVEITNRSGHVLRGIVNIPDEGSRFPAIINVHGFTGNTKISIPTQPDFWLKTDLPASALIYTEMAKATVSSRT